MKNILLKVVLAFVVLSFGFGLNASAQAQQDGTLVYSLPNTSMSLVVKAIKESYVPGPYAKYAKKYLGIDVPMESQQKYSLESIKLVPYLEADQSTRYVITPNSPLVTSNLFKVTSQGLVLLADQAKGTEEYWRFPTLADNYSVDAQGATPNFTNTRTTLYKTVKNAEGGFDKVAIQQSQVVQKSLEKKASEAASTIFSLRAKRVEIITGDTDATFSGEALGAAVAEINRLEAEFLELFLGKRESVVQEMSFDVLPTKENARQLYVAFRISDADGLLQPSNVTGRPIIMEITPETKNENVKQVVTPALSKKISKNVGSELIYRVPTICSVKILDGQTLLLNSRVPIYQFGEILSFPSDIILK